MTAAPHTTRLQAGLGLIPETEKLLSLWEPGMEPPILLDRALSSGEFADITARRLRNIVTEGFAPRYLCEDGYPATLIQALDKQISAQDRKQLFFLFTCRANAILGDFVREVYWSYYQAGSPALSKQAALDFVQASVSEGKTSVPWSDSTKSRIASYLLGACADFGLLGDMRSGTRSIEPFRQTRFTATFLAHDLHFRGLSDMAVVNHQDWLLFGLEAQDVIETLKEIALRGELIMQSAAGVVQISWKLKNMQELADAIANC